MSKKGRVVLKCFQGPFRRFKDEELMMESLTPHLRRDMLCASQPRWRPSLRQRSRPSSSCAPQLAAAVAAESKVGEWWAFGRRHGICLRWLFKLQAPFIGDFPVPIGLNSRMDPLHQLKPQESWEMENLEANFSGASGAGKAKAHGGKFSNIEVRSSVRCGTWMVRGWPRCFDVFSAQSGYNMLQCCVGPVGLCSVTWRHAGVSCWAAWALRRFVQTTFHQKVLGRATGLQQ